MSKNDILTEEESTEDVELEENIRPEHLDEYIGQKDVKENIKVFIESAKKKQHLLTLLLMN